MTDENKPRSAAIHPEKTGIQRALEGEYERDLARAQHLDRVQYDDSTPGSDIGTPYQNKAAPAGATVKDKIYLFPPSFNALRRELEENWQTLFTAVNPMTGVSLAYCMVYDAPQFVSILNGALDMSVQMDSDNVAGICDKFLTALRQKRGLSA